MSTLELGMGPSSHKTDYVTLQAPTFIHARLSYIRNGRKILEDSIFMVRKT